MQIRRWILRAPLLVAATLAAVAVISAEQQHVVPFPEGFRSWQHVKSIVIGPEHNSFSRRGGFHHYYANQQALIGYRTGKFPNGSVIVDEGVFTRDAEGQGKGILMEDNRRSVDVMVKDDRLYRDTGGWGFQHFDGENKTGQLSPSAQAGCHDCHAKAKDRDLVFSSLRP
jgi:hypothetical protein